MKAFNSLIYWSWEALITSIQDDIVYNWFWLKNEYISSSFLWEVNQIDLRSFDNPLSNWRGLLWYYKRGKTLTLDITIRWIDIDDFQTRLDNLRGALFQWENNLDIKVNWVIRRIKALCTSSPKELNHYNITFLKTSITFEALEPFFYTLNYQTSSFLNKTSSFDEEVTNQWNAEAETIISYFFKTWISWTDEIEVQIWDNTIIINETISDNDFLKIDWETKTVKLNDVEVDYDWTFPFLSKGSNIVNFSINGTFETDINILNKKYYV